MLRQFPCAGVVLGWVGEVAGSLFVICSVVGLFLGCFGLSYIACWLSRCGLIVVASLRGCLSSAVDAERSQLRVRLRFRLPIVRVVA